MAKVSDFKRKDDQREQNSSYYSGNHGNYDQGGLGSNGRDLVKYFLSQMPFVGGYNEYLEETINIYKDMCDMCDVNHPQKRKAIPIMLKGPARAYLAKTFRGARNYEE